MLAGLSLFGALIFILLATFVGYKAGRREEATSLYLTYWTGFALTAVLNLSLQFTYLGTIFWILGLLGSWGAIVAGHKVGYTMEWT